MGERFLPEDIETKVLAAESESEKTGGQVEEVSGGEQIFTSKLEQTESAERSSAEHCIELLQRLGVIMSPNDKISVENALAENQSLTLIAGGLLDLGVTMSPPARESVTLALYELSEIDAAVKASQVFAEQSVAAMRRVFSKTETTFYANADLIRRWHAVSANNEQVSLVHALLEERSSVDSDEAAALLRLAIALDAENSIESFLKLKNLGLVVQEFSDILSKLSATNIDAAASSIEIFLKKPAVDLFLRDESALSLAKQCVEQTGDGLQVDDLDTMRELVGYEREVAAILTFWQQQGQFSSTQPVDYKKLMSIATDSEAMQAMESAALQAGEQGSGSSVLSVDNEHLRERIFSAEGQTLVSLLDGAVHEESLPFYAELLDEPQSLPFLREWRAHYVSLREGLIGHDDLPLLLKLVRRNGLVDRLARHQVQLLHIQLKEKSGYRLTLNTLDEIFTKQSVGSDSLQHRASGAQSEKYAVTLPVQISEAYQPLFFQLIAELQYDNVDTYQQAA